MHTSRAVVAGRPHDMPGVQVATRLRKTKTPPALIKQMPAASNNASRCGAATHATATSHAEPTPSEY